MSKIKKLRLFRKDKGINSDSSQTKFPAPRVTLLNRASEVNMQDFITCICDGDFSVLNPGGGATQQQLDDAWETLFYEYQDLTENGSLPYNVKLLAGIRRDENIIECGTAWIEAIRMGFTENCPAALRKIGFDLPFDITDPDSLNDDLASVEGDLRFLSLDLKMRKAELQSINENEKKTSSKEVVERKYFEQIFQAINNYRKWNAVNEQSTVLQFCVALKSFHDAVKASQKVAA